MPSLVAAPAPAFFEQLLTETHPTSITAQSCDRSAAIRLAASLAAGASVPPSRSRSPLTWAFVVHSVGFEPTTF